MKIKIRKNVGAEKKEATQQRPAGATSTGDGEPLPGAEKKEATTRQRPAGATSTGAWGRAEVNPDLESLSVPKMAILFISR